MLGSGTRASIRLTVPTISRSVNLGFLIDLFHLDHFEMEALAGLFLGDKVRSQFAT